MAAGLPVSGIVNVTVNLSPLAAPTRNFGAGLIVGVSPVIDVSERIRAYGSLSAVAQEFGTSAPEYVAASRFFGQVPQPSLVYVGRFAQTDTKAVLHGGGLSAAEQLITNFTSVTAGSMQITVDGTNKTLSALNFSGATNLNGVAAIIDTALTGATVTWDAVNSRFDVVSDSAGTSSTLGYASATGSGTDISSLLKLRTGQAVPPVNGIVAEQLVEALTRLADASGDWYSAIVTAASLSPSAILAAAALIEGQDKKRTLGFTFSDTAIIDPTSTTDIGYLLNLAGYKRTYWQYSTTTPHAVASFFGRAATVDFTGSNTTIDLMFKQEPGVTPEYLTQSQFNALVKKGGNAFVRMDNATSIIRPGNMANGEPFDNIHGLDWLQNDIQTAAYNALYTSPTKIPQTDAGNGTLKAITESRLTQAVRNGLVAPGVWNAAGFGALKQGDTLDSGFYVYVAPVATQSQADREARKGMPQQIAVKLAGSIRSVDAAITVNR